MGASEAFVQCVVTLALQSLAVVNSSNVPTPVSGNVKTTFTKVAMHLNSLIVAVPDPVQMFDAKGANSGQYYFYVISPLLM